MSDTENSDEIRLPPDLRFLKTLVTVLTGVMIAGVIAIVVLLVTRLPGAAVTMPEALDLPPGTEVLAVTQAPTFWIVTTRDNRVLVFEPDGTFRGEVALPGA